MPFVPFVSSSARSPAHYRLVHALETSASPAASAAVALAELSSIRLAWARAARSPARISHDLVLALHCLAHAAPDDLTWLIVEAVKLAGSGTLRERALAYSTCDELLHEHSRPLLLINTIRSDLLAPPTSLHAEIRWSMALRAIASPRIVCRELVPLVQDQVMEFLTSRSPHIRRLTLAAALSLVRTLRSDPNEVSPLAGRLQKHVTTSLHVFLGSAVGSSSTRKSEAEPLVLSALVGALETSSALLPLAPGISPIRISELLLGLLARITAGEWSSARFSYHGVSCPWMASKILRVLQQQLDAMDEIDESMQSETATVLLEYLNSIHDGGAPAHGPLLAALSVLALLPSSMLTSSPSSRLTTSHILQTVKAQINSPDVNLQITGFRCLRLLPIEIWAGEGGTEDRWSEAEWGRIMGGLMVREAGVRKEALLLLRKVDPNLVPLHLERLHETLALATRDEQPRLLSIIMHASAVLDLEVGPWIKTLHKIVKITPQPSPSKSSDEVLDLVVLKTLERLRYATLEDQTEFGRMLQRDEEWRGNLTLAILMLASIGQGMTDERERREGIQIIEDWLHEVEPSFLETVLEPALCAILRLHSALPSGALPALSSLLSSRPDLEALYRHCSTAHGRQALRQAGQDSRRSSLGGFMLALREAVQREQDRAELEPQDTEDLVEAELEGVEEVGTGGMERQERGGRGGKMSESLMSPAALALLVQNAQVLEDEEDELDELTPRGHLSAAIERPSLDIEPPSELLIELAAVDPFSL